MTTTHDVIAAYWAAAEARDWDAFSELVADDVVYEGPQARERVRGRAAYLRFNREGFPGQWHVTVQRIVAEQRHAASWIQMSEGDEAYPGVCCFDLDDEGRGPRVPGGWRRPRTLPR